MKILIPVLSLILSSSSWASPLKLALNWKAEPQFGGFYEAERRQLFKILRDNSSNDSSNIPSVEILQGGSGTPTLQMLLSGQADYAVVSADEIIIAADRGNDNIVAVFATFQKNPQGIMVRATHSAKNLESVFKSSGTLLWQEGLPYAQFLKKKWGPFTIKTAPYLGGLTSFLMDPKIAQQCFITSEPLAAKRQKVSVKTFLIADSGYNPYTTVLAVRRDRLKARPTEVKKIVEAVREGWISYLKDPKLTHEMILKLNPAMDMETLNLSAEAQKSLIDTDAKTPLGTMALERWTDLAGQLKDLGVIKKALEARNLFQNL
jgi:NitT/TauT family transport system substrate-binding protein